MKKFGSQLVIGAVFVLLLGLVPSVAQAALCRNVCTPTASCDLVCTALGGGEPEITTCGEWGRCAGLVSTDLMVLESSADALSCNAAVPAEVLEPSVEPVR